MSNITAGMVKDLREKSGAGMMDCKAALAATNGDMEAAIDWLRAKGIAKGDKKASRVAAEGLVALAAKDTKAVVVEVNSETDFVGRNELFQDMVKKIAGIALETDGDVAALAAKPFPGSNTNVEGFIKELIGTIGENMTLRRFQSLGVSQGVVASYMHGAISDGLGKIGVLVALESSGDKAKLAELGKKIAMHVAATNPVALNSESVDPQIIAREKAILMEKNAGKPANVLEKIAESGLKSYFKEVCLLEQPFVHDTSKTVTQVLKEAEGSVGAPVKLAGFVRYALGEGIEKKEEDFAAEVAAAVKG